MEKQKKFDGNIDISITIGEMITLREKWATLDLVRKIISQDQTEKAYLHASIIDGMLDVLNDYILEPAADALEEALEEKDPNEL